MLNVPDHTRSLWQNLRTKKLFLACSGGLDSMVLLHLFYSLKIDVNVIHVNYQLRGEASDRDAQLVKSVCDELQIPCEIRTVDLKKSLENGGNLQDEARKVRYNWFHEILENDSQNRIALAHHQDDQVETFLMNLARKSGVLGLACMKHENKGIVRPLLDFTKHEILKYAKVNSITWREDQSNKSNAYTRNRLRNEFIPFLKSEIPNLNASVLLLIERFQATQNKLEETVSPDIDSIRTSNLLSIERFNDLTELERVELLRQLNISASYAKRLLELKERGKRLKLHDSAYYAIVRDENQYTFLKREAFVSKLIIEEVNALPKEFNKVVAYFDLSKIQGELRLRKWEIGDRIAPIGMTGSHLISGIIRDSKTTADKRQSQLVLHDDENILWCVGLKISRKALPTDQTEKIIRCSVNVSEEEESEVQ